MKILVTGGAGFIGSAVVRELINNTSHGVINVDALTYAGNLDSVATVADSPRYVFEQVNITHRAALEAVFSVHQPDAVMHLAAESHVDRSIDGPDDFVQTNVIGTYTLLEVARTYWAGLAPVRRAAFRFHHISTDEVYGDLHGTDALFTESTPYAPSSPYSATKAASDHMVRAWQRTYGLPTLVTNCSNNYGPYHFPEKLIPHVILNALQGKPLPVYGKGDQVRDWLYVEDHARALIKVLQEGRVGETYNIGGHNERRNIDVVQRLCDLLDELRPLSDIGDTRSTRATMQAAGLPGRTYRELITHVADRPGHDLRYAIDAGKIQRELGWVPRETFESGLRKTVEWYLSNPGWYQRVLDGSYRGERLGLQIKGQS